MTKMNLKDQGARLVNLNCPGKYFEGTERPHGTRRINPDFKVAFISQDQNDTSYY
jgi:hypothetical protein